MVFTIPALIAMAASLPTGFGFGAGYGAGVRTGYDILYPKIAPIANKFTNQLFSVLGDVWTGDGPTEDLATSTQTDIPTEPTGKVTGPGTDRREAPPDSIVTDERKYVEIMLQRFSSGYPLYEFNGEVTIQELRNMIEVMKTTIGKYGPKSARGRAANNNQIKLYKAIASF